MKHWILKSEPSNYSIDDLEKDVSTAWTGVRNYQARNFILHEWSDGDAGLFYHSNAKPSGVVGIVRITGKPFPDPTAFNPKSQYFEPKATLENPIWFVRTVEFVEKFPQILSLESLRKEEKLKSMLLFARGTRLSIQTLTQGQFSHIVALGRKNCGP